MIFIVWQKWQIQVSTVILSHLHLPNRIVPPWANIFFLIFRIKNGEFRSHLLFYSIWPIMYLFVPNFNANMSTSKVLFRIQKFCSIYGNIFSLISLEMRQLREFCSVYRKSFILNVNTDVSTFRVLFRILKFYSVLGVFCSNIGG